ncbi:acetyl-CoA carboxylase biotin carboxyl carrier protein subunit, partial [Microbulbifer sp.]|uniref:acetyl-CoA carboxylase biotin carboxyl carrier protein subunit n=1 Tax=Microbulbifer sp. TaxID=1908541 RepID=UPI002F95A679
GGESATQAHALACALLHHAGISARDFASGAANWQSGQLPFNREYRLSDGHHSFAAVLCATSSYDYTVVVTAEKHHTVAFAPAANAIPSCGELAVRIDGAIHPVLFHIDDRQLSMLFQQKLWSFADETYMPVQPVSDSGNGLILAPMDGCITQICIEPGATVESGSLLATMEAMKMEHALRADGGGVVTRVNAYAGDQVHSGQLIIEIEHAG